MDHDAFEQILAINRHLSALADAGVPVDVGRRERGESVSDLLQRFAASVAFRIGKGEPVDRAIADNPDLPESYRAALEAGLKTNYPPLVLEGLCGKAEVAADQRALIGRSLMTTIVICTLATIGFLLFCIHVAPTIEGLYEQLEKGPDPALRLLMACRETLPYWAPVPPLLLVGAFFLWRRGRNASGGRGPIRLSLGVARDARYAGLLATMVEKGVPLSEGFRMAGWLAGEPPPAEAARTPAVSSEQGKPAESRQHDPQGLPPLVRWIVTRGQGDPSNAPLLRFAADTYRRKAARQAEHWRIVLPALATLLVAGPVVLAYGLSLFVPLVDLMKMVAE